MKKYILTFLLLSAGVAGATGTEFNGQQLSQKEDKQTRGYFIKVLTFIFEPIYTAVVNYHENYDQFSTELTDVYFK